MGQFTSFIYVFQMFIDSGYADGKKLRHELLRKPDGFILIAGFNTLFPGLPGENQKFRRAVANQPYGGFVVLFVGNHLLCSISNNCVSE